MDTIRGAVLSFIVGFFMDCMMGSVSGLYTLLYVCIFFVSALVSLKVYAEGVISDHDVYVSLRLSQGLFIVLFYKIIYDVNMVSQHNLGFSTPGAGAEHPQPCFF